MLNFGSVYGRVQNQKSLQLSSNGVGGSTLSFPVPPVPFGGKLCGSVWYKIDNINPPIGDTQFALVEANVNTLQFGIEYSGTSEGRLYADLNGDSRFESEVLFDADTYSDWMHIAFFFDFATPANSKVWWNGVEKSLTPPASPNSTQFTPTTSVTDLDNIVSGTSIAQLYLARVAENITLTDFEKSIRKRFSNGVAPLSLGVRGELAQSIEPWIYLTFYPKRGSDGLINDANGAAMVFENYTDYEIVSETIFLPAP